MRFSVAAILASCTLKTVVLGSPVDGHQYDERSPPSPQICSKVNKVVSVLKAFKATAFCSSFLHIPTATVRTTATTSVDQTTTDTTMYDT